MATKAAFRAEGSIPKFWNRTNSGRPLPGPRHFGSPHKAGMNYGCDARISSILNQAPPWVPRHSSVPSTGDRALAHVSAVQSAEQRRRGDEAGEGAPTSQRKKRERFVKAARLWWSQQQLRDTYDNYKRQLIPVSYYYASTKKKAGMANYSILRNIWETSRIGVMHHWNRRSNPQVIGKDPVKVDAGETKYGWKSDGDPFLINGPLTQLHHSIRVHDDYRTDGKLMLPTGIPWNLGQWANRVTTQDKLHRNLEKRTLQGKNNYATQTGIFSLKKRVQQDWYQSLLSMPVWRLNFMPNSQPHRDSSWYLKMASTRGHNVRKSLAPSRMPLTRAYDPSQFWQTGDQFSDGDLGDNRKPWTGRLERPELPAL